jgi:hypothetical protein
MLKRHEVEILLKAGHAQTEVARPVMDHRGAEFATIVKEALENMRTIVQTRGSIAMFVGIRSLGSRYCEYALAK